MYSVPKPRTREDVPTHQEAPNGPQRLSSPGKKRLSTKESFLADAVFRSIVILCALAVVAVVGLICFELVSQSRISMSKFSFRFLIKSIWNPMEEDFGALPFIYGTVVSS